MKGGNHLKKIIINGRFVSQRITGVQRYAIEVTKELDKMASGILLPIEIAIPVVHDDSALETVLQLEKKMHNIKIVRIGKRHGIAWEQLDLAKYIHKENALGIYFCNAVPIFAPPGFVCIHDITYKVNPQFVTTWRLKIIQLWNKLQFHVATKKSLHIFTVSEFSRRQISEVYNVPMEKITNTYSAWQHYNTEIAPPDTLDAFPMLHDKGYYFAMATLAANKNFKWIIENARYNPNSIYAMAGHVDKQKLGDTLGKIPSNVFLLGYVSDNDAKILLKHCKAFLFPSLYEGFGLPPLEALAMGAPIICSNVASLPEVYGDGAHYIDPYDANVNLDAILCEPVAPAQSVLDKYSFKKIATKYVEEIVRLLDN